MRWKIKGVGFMVLVLASFIFSFSVVSSDDMPFFFRTTTTPCSPDYNQTCFILNSSEQEVVYDDDFRNSWAEVSTFVGVGFPWGSLTQDYSTAYEGTNSLKIHTTLPSGDFMRAFYRPTLLGFNEYVTFWFKGSMVNASKVKVFGITSLGGEFYPLNPLSAKSIWCYSTNLSDGEWTFVSVNVSSLSAGALVYGFGFRVDSVENSLWVDEIKLGNFVDKNFCGTKTSKLTCVEKNLINRTITPECLGQECVNKTEEEFLEYCELGCTEGGCIECIDIDEDRICDYEDACLNTTIGEEVDEEGCDIFQFCDKFNCGIPCFSADWKNNEPLKKYPKDCIMIILEKEGKQYPKCVPTVDNEICAG